MGLRLAVCQGVTWTSAPTPGNFHHLICHAESLPFRSSFRGPRPVQCWAGVSPSSRQHMGGVPGPRGPRWRAGVAADGLGWGVRRPGMRSGHSSWCSMILKPWAPPGPQLPCPPWESQDLPGPLTGHREGSNSSPLCSASWGLCCPESIASLLRPCNRERALLSHLTDEDRDTEGALTCPKAQPVVAKAGFRVSAVHLLYACGRI